jgi:hypothetical protein
MCTGSAAGYILHVVGHSFDAAWGLVACWSLSMSITYVLSPSNKYCWLRYVMQAAPAEVVASGRNVVILMMCYVAQRCANLLRESGGSQGLLFDSKLQFALFADEVGSLRAAAMSVTILPVRDLRYGI